MYELNIRYTYTAAIGNIAPAGIEAIIRFINRQRLTDGDWQGLNPAYPHSFLPALPYDWQWVWVVTGKAEYVGTFPRRASKFWHKQGIKAPASFLTELGNLARRHSLTQPAFEFEFVNQFDWRAGEFGDNGSCYWWANAGGRAMLAANGAHAIRFYGEFGRGVARAWLVPCGDLFIVFNGYGFPGDATLIIASVFAGFMGLTYASIDLENNGNTTGQLYINGGHGYIVGTPDAIAGIDAWDFGWDDIYNYVCEACGAEIGNEYDTYTGDDGYTYCENCYYERFGSCYHCGETFEHDALYYVNDNDVCEYCLDRFYTRCDGCEEFFRDGDLTTTETGAYCEDCLPADEE